MKRDRRVLSLVLAAVFGFNSLGGALKPALFLLATILLVQAPDPDYVGPEDPAHEGQPKTCSNSAHIKAVKQDCHCDKKTKEQCDPNGRMEDSTCLVYCRKPACKCRHPICDGT